MNAMHTRNRVFSLLALLLALCLAFPALAEEGVLEGVELEEVSIEDLAPQEETLVSNPLPIDFTGGFLPLPEEGERTQQIIQTLEDGSVWRNVIRMTPEGFSMIESDCEGKDCIEEGEVTLENRQDRLLWNMVICAPHRLTLSLYTPEEAVELSKTILGF
jgi:hypothetical protein